MYSILLTHPLQINFTAGTLSNSLDLFKVIFQGRSTLIKYFSNQDHKKSHRVIKYAGTLSVVPNFISWKKLPACAKAVPPHSTQNLHTSEIKCQYVCFSFRFVVLLLQCTDSKSSSQSAVQSEFSSISPNPGCLNCNLQQLRYFSFITFTLTQLQMIENIPLRKAVPNEGAKIESNVYFMASKVSFQEP